MSSSAGTSRPRISVVGLGPGAPEHVTEQTRVAIETAQHRYLRTARHPSADLVTNAVSFDHLYDEADTFEAVYESIVDRLVAAAGEHGEILYAVPGSPMVLERTVRLLRAHDQVTGDHIELDVLPAISFLDVAWAQLGIDPVETSVRLVDGHEFARAAAGERGPLLVAHTHANWVLSEIKLAVDDADGSEEVLILQGLGTGRERIVHTTWAALDRTIEADHLTSIYIPRLATPVGASYVRFHELTRTLRERCPWDIEQTHETLVPHLLEETYEVVDAIRDRAADIDDPAGVDVDDHLIEELGDLLYQIEFHATIAEQEGRFTIADVADGIHDKLVRRHPHVFGDVDATDTETVLANWDDIKRIEKGRTSVFDGVPRSMPALAYASKLAAKAAKLGFDWPSAEGAFAKIDEERHELTEAIAAGARDDVEDELGDVLFAVVNVARHLGVDAELALRAAADKFRRRFELVERLASDRRIDLAGADLPTLDAMWDEAKVLLT
jgi:tetrapyrrole methylase family protein/MazG family protein